MKKNELKHYGVRGQKWGRRQYQNEDGTLTSEGKVHYGLLDGQVRKVTVNNKGKVDWKKYNNDNPDAVRNHKRQLVKYARIAAAAGLGGYLSNKAISSLGRLHPESPRYVKNMNTLGKVYAGLFAGAAGIHAIAGLGKSINNTRKVNRIAKDKGNTGHQSAMSLIARDMIDSYKQGLLRGPKAEAQYNAAMTLLEVEKARNRHGKNNCK